MRLILLSLTLVFNLHAVELSQASNQQIMQELSKRLSTTSPAQDAILNAYCLSDELHFELETQTQTIKKSVELRFSSDCKKALTILKLGQFSGFNITAFCVNDEMYKVKAASQGKLDISIIDHRTSSECEASAAQINRQ
jgi:hypothetical protein